MVKNMVMIKVNVCRGQGEAVRVPRPRPGRRADRHLPAQRAGCRAPADRGHRATSRGRWARCHGRPTFEVPPAFFEPLPDDELDAVGGDRGARDSDARSRRRLRASPKAGVQYGGRGKRTEARRRLVRLLLDTCTFLWLAGGGSLSNDGEPTRSATPANEVFLSAASVWEIVTKYERGRLPLPEPPERLIPAERRLRGSRRSAFDEESALHGRRLPWLHRDPFDRMLIAQAIAHGLAIVTPDPLIAQYPDSRRVVGVPGNRSARLTALPRSSTVRAG